MLLIHANHVVSVDRLIDELWGEAPPSTAKAQVHRYVSALRRIFDDAASPDLRQAMIVTSPPGYLLRVERGQLDLYEFDRLARQAREVSDSGHPESAVDAWRAALALWRGPALGGATGDLVAAEAVRLGERRVAALEERIDVELALGRHADLVGELTALVADEPLRDRLRGQLMVALYRSGRRADALEVYQRGQDRLNEGFGIDPGPALQELHYKILCDDPALLAGKLEPPPLGTGISDRSLMPGLSTIIRAKLVAPVARKLVSRSELVANLTEGPPRKLTLICATAGSGKSSLLADWHIYERERRLFCWLSIDHADNDPMRFWNHLIEALRAVAPKIGGIALDGPVVSGGNMIQVALPWLFNEVRTLQNCVTLVLDDYHLITNVEIHKQLTLLLEYLPSTLEIAIATRNLPPLPLARFRARGELLEIGTAQLLFSEAEAEALVNGVLGLGLRHSDVSRLWRHMEGWAAGLYLGARTLTWHSDQPTSVEVFDDYRHIFDYLAAEVLDQQPAVVRDFLLQTSILERMCGPLCDAVTGTSGSRQMLDTLERSNLFVVPLDRTGEWYRYHRVFGWLLGLRLRSHQPELVSMLHQRAAAWYLQAGWLAHAFGHTEAAAKATDTCGPTTNGWPAISCPDPVAPRPELPLH